MERRAHIASPGGTITRTVWTSPQRVASVWVGTNDIGQANFDRMNDASPTATGALTAGNARVPTHEPPLKPVTSLAALFVRIWLNVRNAVGETC